MMKGLERWDLSLALEMFLEVVGALAITQCVGAMGAQACEFGLMLGAHIHSHYHLRTEHTPLAASLVSYLA